MLPRWLGGRLVFDGLWVVGVVMMGVRWKVSMMGMA